MKNKTKIALKTGLTKLDAMIGGFRCGELAVIAGRPSMGTTALLYTIINNGIIDSKKKLCALIVQPGLSTIETRLRFDCLNASVDLCRATGWRITSDEFKRLRRADKKIFNMPSVLTFDWPAIKKLSRMRKEAIEISENRQLRVIAVDHLQSLGADLSPEDMTNMCVALRGLAKKLDVAVILLSRVPRIVERRSTFIPKLSDIKAYGDMEKNADKILFIYREEYYVPTDRNKGVAKIIVAKNKGGQVGAVEVKFTRPCLRFDNA